ncbi:MAG: 4-alpha-glucanotransferase, partial [Thiohalocapsa sp.]|nr:4-alpha-glucanotransferase [Thiohalocapsa sp.]
MNPTPELDRLCAHFGIAATYRDFRGEEQRADDYTRRALLRALGVDAGDPDTEARSLRETLDRSWRRMLPPVVVRRQGDPAPTLALTMPEDGPEAPCFVLLEEDGTRADGVINLDALPVDERRDIDGRAWLRRTFSVPTPSVLGYHRLLLYADDRSAAAAHADGQAGLAETTVIVAPERCWQPQDAGGRSFGLITQLPALRSARNWGIGDFTDLMRLVEIGAAAGAGMIAPGPLHALFPTRPERCNPYAPSSRRFLNPLYIDVDAVPDVLECEAARARIDSDDFRASLRALRGEPLLDYGGVAAAKLDMLTRLFRHFRTRHLEPGSERAQAFAGFRRAQGDVLERFGLFQALAEHMADADTGPRGFDDWPEPLRDPDSEAVRDFARAHAERIDFFVWVQWIAQQQLEAAAARCAVLGMPYGLCLDLAVGAAPDGADCWTARGRYVSGAHVGAPPDDFSPKGQDWHVLAWHPMALRESGYAPFAAELRANMQAAGALRIDHIMGLMRLYLVPEGAPAHASTYVAYPFEELLGVLALESVRNRCMIIGEDLGTVPDEVRAAMSDNGILSTRVLYFERAEDGGFPAPGDYPPDAVVTAGTHDLPPLAGFWQGIDLERRRELSLFPTEQDYEQRLLQRGNDRARLLFALDREGLLPAADGVDPVSLSSLSPAHLRAVQVYLARTPSRLMLLQTSDLLGETEQVNLPGSGSAYPNWRRRQSLALEHWLEQPDIGRTLGAVRGERGASADVPAPLRRPAGGDGAERAAAERAPESSALEQGGASGPGRGRGPALRAAIPRA